METTQTSPSGGSSLVLIMHGHRGVAFGECVLLVAIQLWELSSCLAKTGESVCFYVPNN